MLLEVLRYVIETEGEVGVKGDERRSKDTRSGKEDEDLE